MERRQEHQPAPSVIQKKDVVLPDHKIRTEDPSHTTLSSGQLSLAPSPDCQHPAQTPQPTGVLTPRPLLGPQSTTSSQRFPGGTQAEPDQLRTVTSADVQCRSATPGPIPTAETTGKQGEDTKQGKTTSGARPPSPQLSVLGVTDKQPVTSMQDDSLLR